MGECPCFFCILFWRCFKISKQDIQINDEIRDKEVRVIGADGAQLGIMTGAKALAMAEAAELDLVKIAPQAQPPVCKIMDYGKYRFEQAKREKEARKNQRVVDIKEDGSSGAWRGNYEEICRRLSGIRSGGKACKA